MKNQMKKISLIILSIMLIIGLSTEVDAFIGLDKLEKSIDETAAYIHQKVSDPQVASIGGEWALIGLARSDYKISEKYYEDYYKTLEKLLESKKGNLHDKKHTEYSRIVLALTSMGKDPRNVAGYNLLSPLGDYEKTIFQGLNGPIWALIALDSGDYEMPINKDAKVQASREMYLNKILDSQLDDGGWSLMGGSQYASGNEKTDPDMTGMALQAISKYKHIARVEKAIEEGLSSLSLLQDEDGGFSSWGSKNLESNVQLIVALGELGLSLEDKRFVKNGNTLLDNLFEFYIEGKGFKHSKEDKASDQMASEQGLYGLVAAKRLRKDENSLYKMKNIVEEEDVENNKNIGLEKKHEDINKMPIIKENISFEDISTYKYKNSIESLAERGIINGKSEKFFDPKGNMTRAEFATIIVQALGLEGEKREVFTDVGPDTWFYQYISTANRYGIVAGISKDKFNPNGTIKKEEALSMLARAGELAGMEVEKNKMIIRDILSQFEDYISISDWAMPSMAFAYKENILDDSSMKVEPSKIITRGEIAEMLFNMLDKANLL